MSDCVQGIEPCECKGKGHRFQRVGLLGCFSLVKERKERKEWDLRKRSPKPFWEFKTVNSCWWLNAKSPVVDIHEWILSHFTPHKLCHKYAGKFALQYKLGVDIPGRKPGVDAGFLPCREVYPHKFFNKVLTHFPEPGERVKASYTTGTPTMLTKPSGQKRGPIRGRSWLCREG